MSPDKTKPDLHVSINIYWWPAAEFQLRKKRVVLRKVCVWQIVINLMASLMLI